MNKEVSSVDGSLVFKACSGCHGSQGERKAMGKSQIIKGWEASKVVDVLNGYKVGTYGGAMKGIMKGQVSKLSDAQIRAVATYISEQ
ncbi:MAG: c-type cytochrome [Sulfurimonas sp.]